MTQSAAPPVLSARGIRKSFGGVEVLHGVDLDAVPGRVLALLGENGAGKSTLVKVISGDYQPDDGSLEFGDDVRRRLTPITARGLGVRMIYQELNDAPPLSVAENIFLGRLPHRRGFVRWGEVRRAARAILEDLEVDIDPAAPMSTLGVGERQVIEIARALTDRARLLILDEPTAALSGDETDRLFEFIGRLRRRGTAMIYITHRLDELQRIADEVVVLRDGHVVLTDRVANTTRPQLVEAMVGDWVGEVARPADVATRAGDPPTLSLRGASHPGAFRDVDLDIHAGEVVALYGKLGAGTGEVVEALYGLRGLERGTFRLATDARSQGAPRSPREAIRRGLGFLPADRKQAGAFLPLSCAQNLAAPSWPTMARAHGMVRRSGERKAFDHWRDRLLIRAPAGGDRPIATLSGGNQQKVLLARWLHARSHVLMLVEPTRGVDVGARQEIYQALRKLAAEGIAVLVATSDYEEVVQLADRAVVMAAGRVTRELAAGEISVANLTDAAAG
jgi:ribose transport system ATP-binding protein